jgi:hypothetical protein
MTAALKLETSRLCHRCTVDKPIDEFRLCADGSRRRICRTCGAKHARSCGWCGGLCPVGDRSPKRFCSGQCSRLATAARKRKTVRKSRPKHRAFSEPAANPIWLRRADQFCRYLVQAGPQTHDEIDAWRRSKRWTQSGITNVLAIVDGHGAAFVDGRWSMSVGVRRVA